MIKLFILMVITISALMVESFMPLMLLEDDTLKILPKTRADESLYRLPGESIPSDYTVILDVDPNVQESFYGEVSIKTWAKVVTRQIVMHANPKNITSIEVTPSIANGTNIFANYSLSGGDTNFLTIYLTQELVIDAAYIVNIKFLGTYGRFFDGLYLTSYEDVNNTVRNIATTQFAPVSARDAFPCYDEPGLKATFQVNIYAPDGYYAISNTDVTNSTTLPKYKNRLSLFAFERTVKMSSYLVAFVVSDFTYISNFDQGNLIFPKKIRIFAKPGTEPYMEFSLENSQYSMRYLQKYTNVTYALSKLDNVGIPALSFGAMENWGIIIYREQFILHRPNDQTTRDLQRTSTIINHENAHMWFGNEISPAWWGYVWLSEGFATFFESFANDAYAPEWRLMDQYIPEVVFNAMAFDSQTYSNPMSSSVATPTEINNNFNRIAYDKAGSVIRMMQHVLGADVFQQGIRIYFKSIPLGVGRPEILFEGLQQAVENRPIFPSGITVHDVFGSWSTQIGFPIIRAVKSDDKRTLLLTQERYYENPNLSSSETWWVPINWVTSKNVDFQDTSPQDWLRPFGEIHQISLDLTNDTWYILNKQTTGYYRIMYDAENWNLVSNALKTVNFGGIHLRNRLQILNDVMEFARTLRLSPSTTFDVLSHLKEEDDYLPWLTIYSNINMWNNLMPGAENYQLYREFIRQISKKTYDSVGLDTSSSDDYITKMKRNYITNIACNTGNEYCLLESNLKVYQLIQNSSNTFHPDVRSIIYCSGMRRASESLWISFFSKYLGSNSSSEKTTIINNLACSENSTILQNYLGMTAANGLVEAAYRYTVIQSVLNSGYIGVDNAVDFITNYFDIIKSSMPQSTVNIINLMGQRIIAKNHINQFEIFSQTFPNFSSQERSAVDNALNTIRNNRNWLDVILVDLDPWLEENVDPNK